MFRMMPLCVPLLTTACAAGVAPQARETTTTTLNPYQPRAYVEVQHPEWSRTAAIYQINTRQFTPEGTFDAARAELPRIKALGTDIIWLMPIHEIGEKNRKGTLGSPYAVRDYFSVNPEFGTLQDLKDFVQAAHELGMYVILDWVANHTAWDNPLVTEHPEWYERDWQGNFRPTPWWDWSDIIDLDYSHAELRRYMTRALRYWVEEAGIDGYRCDVAWYVPIDFWENARRELEEIKPVFMLAEAEVRDVHARAFNASYAWSWHNAMHKIAMGDADVTALFGYYSGNESAWPMDAMRMTFVSNHDKNAWEGTQFELFDDALEPAIVLSVVGEGIPLIYNGQEAGNRKRLAFFEKDPIEWQPHPVGELYSDLFSLKKANSALWNGRWGARMIHVPNDAPREVFSFVRKNDDNAVFAVLNLSDRSHTVNFGDGPHTGNYVDFASGADVLIGADWAISLAPWSWAVFSR